MSSILEKKYNVAYKCDATGKCIDVAKVKVVGSAEYQQLLKESNQHKEVVELEQEKVLKDIDTKHQEIVNKEFIQNLFIAKGYFDNLCDRGLCETNETFENMFFEYVDKGIMFDLHSENVPPHFIKVLERLGYKL